MKIGVVTSVAYDVDFKAAIERFHGMGIQAVEPGCGGFPGDTHLKPEEYLGHPEKVEQVKQWLADHDMVISAFSCHGNCVHPNPEVAADFQKAFENTVLMAEMFGVDTINTFSGCPGGEPGAKHPNWVTCAWPPEFGEVLDYQWNEVLIPYWKEAVKFANAHGVRKIALEMHPGFCVYNPETLLKLRDAVGDTIGANFDPSHLFWQGINPVNALRALKGAVYHFHAKDTKIDEINTAVNGVLDTKTYVDELNRSWMFRSLGYGHDYAVWKDIISTLRMIGYDGAISIEHEDSVMSGGEGLKKTVAFLKEVLMFEPRGEVWWV